MSLTFFVKPLPGERVEANLTLPEAHSCLILGTIRHTGGDAAPGLPVLLFQDGEDSPSMQCITDAHGLFCFGPLEGDQLYQVCVFQTSGRTRRLDVQL